MLTRQMCDCWPTKTARSSPGCPLGHMQLPFRSSPATLAAFCINQPWRQTRLNPPRTQPMALPAAPLMPPAHPHARNGVLCGVRRKHRQPQLRSALGHVLNGLGAARDGVSSLKHYGRLALHSPCSLACQAGLSIGAQLSTFGLLVRPGHLPVAVGQDSRAEPPSARDRPLEALLETAMRMHRAVIAP